MQLDATRAFIYGTIWLGLAGGLGCLGAHHRLKVQRSDRRGIARSERKSDFLSFMEGWRTEIEGGIGSVIPTEFDDKCADFRTRAAKVRVDYGAEFWRLSNSLSGLCSDPIDEGHGDETPPRRDKLLRGLDAVINFVKAN